MTFIHYDKKKKIFFATGLRPSNQNSKPVLEKIAKRLQRYVLKHNEVCLTDLQQKFITKVAEKRRFLSAEDIDIAHHIAISKIIKLFVYLMNHPKSIQLNDLDNFADAICSTESPNDDKGRSTLREFFEDVTNGEKPRYLCETANYIIKLLNRCTRNLIPGHKSVNRSIGEKMDLHLVATHGNPKIYKETSTSKLISTFFAPLPKCHHYAPKSLETKGKRYLLSSSVAETIEDSYVYKSNSSYRGM